MNDDELNIKRKKKKKKKKKLKLKEHIICDFSSTKENTIAQNLNLNLLFTHVRGGHVINNLRLFRY